MAWVGSVDRSTNIDGMGKIAITLDGLADT